MSLETGRSIAAVRTTEYHQDYRKRAGSGSVKVTVDQADFGGSLDITYGDLVCVEGIIGFAIQSVSVRAATAGYERTADLVLQTERALYELAETQLDTTGTYDRGTAVFAEITSEEALVTVTDQADGNRFIGVADGESDDVLWFYLEPFTGIGIEAAAYSG